MQTWSGIEATIFCQQQWRDELTDLEASVNDANQITGDVESPLQLRDGALHVAAGQGLGKVSKGQGGEEHLGWSAERRAGRSRPYFFEVAHISILDMQHAQEQPMSAF